MFRFFTWIHGLSLGFVLFLGFHFGTAYALGWKKTLNVAQNAVHSDSKSEKTNSGSEGNHTTENSPSNNESMTLKEQSNPEKTQHKTSSGYSQRQSRDQLSDR
jgi:hypothetical protein